MGVNSIITWDDAWLVGIDDIDNDHRKLVELIQKLFGALISAQGADYIQQTYFELIDYTRYHFQREEEIYSDHNYPALTMHHALHEDLVQQVLDLSKSIIGSGKTETVSDEIYEFLKTWLVDHILEEDMKFKAFVGQNN